MKLYLIFTWEECCKVNVVGVRFRKAGKIYYFDAGDENYKCKQSLVVETENGLEIGEVALINLDIDEEKFNKKLKKVVRIANDEDLKRKILNNIEAKEALEVCQSLADSYKLNMKLVDSYYTLDKNKLVFFFTSDKRVDFRELVKDLAQRFRSRIELRQIGVRDHAKLIQHFGTCGQQCCCSRHLTDFVPLSIKYAKDQNISLDPAKISGVCGRLMCCLSFEEDNYMYMKKIMPKCGQKVNTEEGCGVVLRNDYVKEECRVRIKSDDEENIEKIFKLSEINLEM